MRSSFCLAAALVLFSQSGMTTIAQEQEYQPTWESLDQRECPEWFLDAKFGIFIHWGVYAVPAWAPEDTYSEWYWRWMGSGVDGKPPEGEESEVWKYHVNTYGEDFLYHDFAKRFKAQNYDPAYWAQLFKEAGARYVVPTSKHHDGYCMFPCEIANRSWGRPWNSMDVGPHRDLLGELAEAVRAEGLKFGFYYSLYEWYNPLWLTDRELFVEKHMIPQFKNVVRRYEPSLIFADGEWDMPADNWKSTELIAWLYNETPMGDTIVVNDRWGDGIRHNHGDYYTTEYASGMGDASHPWEENRGMGHSYGFNRNEELDDYRTSRELTLMLIDLVSRGGNLLLNVGPTADGRIPEIQQQRLSDMGSWLKVNGEAIYGTRMWAKSRQWSEGEIPTVEYGGQYMVEYDINEVTGERTGNQAVVECFFTCKDDTVYAISPRWPGEQFTIRDIETSDQTRVTLLGHEEELAFETGEQSITIQLPGLAPDEAPVAPAWTFKITSTR